MGVSNPIPFRLGTRIIDQAPQALNVFLSEPVEKPATMTSSEPKSEGVPAGSPVDWLTAGIGTGLMTAKPLRATRDNWRIYPWSRWAFQHTRELVPSRPLKRSKLPRELKVSSIDLGAMTFRTSDGEELSWSTYEERTFTDGTIILLDGKLIHERYLNGMHPESAHHAFSVTKSFVGLIAEILLAQGMLDPAARVCELVPDLSCSAFATVTVRHLLDMTDGVAFDEDYANPEAEIHRYSSSYWTPAQADGGARAFASRMSRRDGPPGSAFSYRTPVADVLGWCLHAATGVTLTELFQEMIWDPAGCSDAAHFLLDVDGDEIAASGLNTSLRDLARLALFVMEGDGIPPAARASILSGGDRELFARSAYSARSAGSYRSQWWIMHDEYQSISALGVFGQRIQLDMASGLALVRYGSHPVASNLATDPLHRAAMDALRKALR